MDLRKFNFSLSVQNIAVEYQEVEAERYQADRPLIAYICRNLSALVKAVNSLNAQIQICSGNNCQRQCRNSQNDIQPNNYPA